MIHRTIFYLKCLFRKKLLGDHVIVGSTSDVPQHIGNKIFIVGHEKPKWAIFMCPCRCNEIIQVNLMSTHKPNWRVMVGHKGITLYPSVWIHAFSCKSHFWLKDNKVWWVYDP